MDSTFIDAETIDKLARVVGVVSEKSTKRVICGALDFGKTLTEMIRLFEGFCLETVYDAVNYIPETAEFTLCAKKKSNKSSMISGIFINPFETIVGIGLIISNCQRCNQAQHVDIEQ